jgi:signal transduction histidine kinase/CheY-like chemotaxis protein
MVILTVNIRDERDVVLARQRARQVAGLLRFDSQDQTRIATAVSEIARNAYSYAGGGRAEICLEGATAPQVLIVRVIDQGRGIHNLDHVLSGQYRSSTGMGVGLTGSRRLMDGFEIQSSESGTTVCLKKILPEHTPVLTGKEISSISEELARQRPAGAFEEVQQQNQELLSTLEELRRRQAELQTLNGELEDTNRGVVALYAELDEKAEHLRRADQLKTRFLSDMSHEFRTPLNSIIGLSRILAGRIDGPLTAGQAKQVSLIESSAHELLTLVNDLLDLAKVEAGKIDIRPSPFKVSELFGALRGMLRPLLVSESVRLTFDDVDESLCLFTDEAKVSQILRNFISNALKFTDHGEVCVSMTRNAREGHAVTFFVRDTGIGIAPEHHEHIFEEFSQIDNAIQRRVKGTGLGLPLTRKLASLLGGSVGVESAPGAGSTFWFSVPAEYKAAEGSVTGEDAPLRSLDPALAPVLVVEDQPVDQMLYEKYLKGTRYQPVVVRNLSEARRMLREFRPAAIILDVMLGGENTWGLLAELKREPHLAAIPVLMVTTIDDEAKASTLGVDAFMRKPLERRWLLDQLASKVPQEHRV